MAMKSPQASNRGKASSSAKEIKQQSTMPIRLKTVVRRLPPNLPEAIFWQSVQPWVTEQTVSWKIYHQGKLKKKLNKENIPSRAYLLFKNEEALTVFNKEFDGHVFRDKQGNESQAVVEFAPNQKVPSEKKKADARQGTIQQDEDYLSFIASLQNPQEKPAEVELDALLASTIPYEEPKTTPLLAALHEQKQQSQEKKIASAEAAKAPLRKVASPPQKPEPAGPPAPAKKGKKGKGAQPAAATAAPSTPAIAQPPPSKTSGNTRGRSNPSQAGAAAAALSPSSSPSTTTISVPGNKETSGALSTTPPSVGEPSQRRNRPTLGPASRHLKAALSGAGVQVAQASSSTAPSTAKPQSGPSEGKPRGGSRGRGGAGGDGDQRVTEENNVNEGRGGGGRGRGGGKQRQRPAPQSNGLTTVARSSETITPRILTRQEPPPAGFGVVDPTNINRPAPGLLEIGGGNRGRGGRRGRGQ